MPTAKRIVFSCCVIAVGVALSGCTMFRSLKTAKQLAPYRMEFDRTYESGYKDPVLEKGEKSSILLGGVLSVDLSELLGDRSEQKEVDLNKERLAEHFSTFPTAELKERLKKRINRRVWNTSLMDSEEQRETKRFDIHIASYGLEQKGRLEGTGLYQFRVKAWINPSLKWGETRLVVQANIGAGSETVATIESLLESETLREKIVAEAIDSLSRNIRTYMLLRANVREHMESAN